MTTEFVFLTGTLRSGTSLTAELLGAQRHCSSMSQPLPLLLVELKKEFQKLRGVPEYSREYPLNDQVFDNHYQADEFRLFLESFELTSDFLLPVLESMRLYSGQYFKPKNTLAMMQQWHSGTLMEFIEHYVAHQNPDSQLTYWKETIAEELVPYLASAEVKVGLSLRDPRDVIASQISGRFEHHSGARRPLLFMLRQWRKSASYALAFAKHSGVTVFRYEDLVKAPTETLAELKFKGNIAGISRQVSSSGNSSFKDYDNVSEASVGNYREHLPHEHREFIEACCFYDMLAWGYKPTITADAICNILQEGPTIDFTERPELSQYRYTAQRKVEETKRLTLLRDNESEFDPSIFIFNTTFQRLKGEALQ